MQMRVATILDRNLDRLLQEWLNSRQPSQTTDGALLLTTETTHDLRRLLEGIIHSLQHPGEPLPEELQDYAQGLGRHYQAQGGELQGIISEFAALRIAIWHLLGESLRNTDQAITSIGSRLDDALDSFMLGAIKAYGEAYSLAVTQAAALDSLTRTFTRGYLMEQLRLELERARRYRHPFTILLIDLDRFKKVNDTFGHLAGDEALRQFSAVLLEASRSADVVGRYGGEEFLVLLTETPVSGAIAVANRLLHRLAEAQISTSDTGEVLTASIGLAAYPEAGTTLDALIGASDAALYEAKSKGGNAFAIRRPDGSFEVVKPALAPTRLAAPSPPPLQTPISPLQGPMVARAPEPPTPEVVPPPAPEPSIERRQPAPVADETPSRAPVEERVLRLERSMSELAGTLERLQERLIIIGGLQRSAEERSASQPEGGATNDNGRLVQMLEEEKERLGGRVEQLRGDLNSLIAEMEELRGIVRRHQPGA